MAQTNTNATSVLDNNNALNNGNVLNSGAYNSPLKASSSSYKGTSANEVDTLLRNNVVHQLSVDVPKH